MPGEILRACSRCGQPFKPRHARHRHCARHEPHGREHRSPTTRAQDATYRAERARVLAGHPVCAWCGAPATCVDHVIPVAAGGTHEGNLQPACQACNASRQDRAAPSTHTSSPPDTPATPPAQPIRPTRLA